MPRTKAMDTFRRGSELQGWGGGSVVRRMGTQQVVSFCLLIRGRTHGAGCVRQWFRTAEPLGERRYENWNTHMSLDLIVSTPPDSQ